MTDVWRSNKMYWCEFCKVWMQDKLTIRTKHDQSDKHKDNVQRKIREGQRKGEREERELAQAKRELERAEREAQRKFREDQGLLSKREMAQKKLETAANAEVKKAAELAYRVQQTGVSWQYDPGSGYYFSPELGYYFDSATQTYYGGDPPAWSNVSPLQAADYEKFYDQGGPAGPGPAALPGGGSGAPAAPGPAARPPGRAPGPGTKPAGTVKVVPVQKVVQGTNSSLGGRQMSLYAGSAGSTRLGAGAGARAGGLSKPVKKIAKGGKKPGKPLDPAEAKALAAREAARRRVEQRSLKEFGLG